MPNQAEAPIDSFIAEADSLHGFEISGADENYVPAKAVIEGNTVVITHPSIPNPIAVRYAFHSFTLANLYNKDGFPAEQFKTDRFDWPSFRDGYPSHKDPPPPEIPVGIDKDNPGAVRHDMQPHLYYSNGRLYLSFTDMDDESRMHMRDFRGRRIQPLHPVQVINKEF